MHTNFDHNKLLTKITKERLSPHGIFQKGKSRTFLRDGVWFVIVIEFQPSSGRRGTYLNISVDFNFYPREYFAFGFGYRGKGFEEAEDEIKFTDIVTRYCDIAIELIENLNQGFQDISAAIKTYGTKPHKDGWYNFDMGVLHGISGNFSEAKKYLKKVLTEKIGYQWAVDRNKLTGEILGWLEDEASFEQYAIDLIKKTRQLKKLPAIQIEQLAQKKAKPKNIFAFWRNG